MMIQLPGETIALLGAGLLNLVIAILAWRRRRRLLALLVFVVVIFYVSGGILIAYNQSPLSGLELLLIAFLVSVMVMAAWVVFGLRLLSPAAAGRVNLIDQMSEGVLVMDQRNRLLDMNPAACRLLNFDRAPIGHDAAIALADWPLLAEHFWGDSNILVDVHQDGDPQRDFELRRTILTDYGGKTVGRLIMLRDLTLHKQAEREADYRERVKVEMESARNMLAAVVKQAPFPMILVSMPFGEIQVVNQPCLEFLGLEHELNLVGVPVVDLKRSWRIYDELGNEPPDEELPLQQAMWYGKTIHNKVYSILTRRGDERWAQVSSAPIYHSSGEMIAAFVAYSDITARRQAESAVRTSEELYRRLADNVRDVIWTMDLVGRFTYISPSVERLRGYSVREVMQQGVDEAFMPEGANSIMEWIRSSVDVLRQGRRATSGRYDVQERHKNGSLVWTEVNISPINNQADQLIGLLGVSRDISETKKIANALVEKSAELERLAITDGLTGLFNRRHADQRVSEEFQRSLRYGTPLSLGSFDLDNFKLVNDRFGHTCGDEVIKMVADELRSGLRVVDFAARVGGEEFLVLFPNTRLNEAYEAMERLRERLSGLVIPCMGESITISGGVTAWFPGDNAGDALRRVDRLLYQAKAEGRNKIVKDALPK